LLSNGLYHLAPDITGIYAISLVLWGECGKKGAIWSHSLSSLTLLGGLTSLQVEVSGTLTLIIEN